MAIRLSPEEPVPGTAPRRATARVLQLPSRVKPVLPSRSLRLLLLGAWRSAALSRAA